MTDLQKENKTVKSFTFCINHDYKIIIYFTNLEEYNGFINTKLINLMNKDKIKKLIIFTTENELDLISFINLEKLTTIQFQQKIYKRTKDIINKHYENMVVNSNVIIGRINSNSRIKTDFSEFSSK